LWRVDILGGLELLRARFVEFTFPPHAHDEFMIALTEGGMALPTYRGGAHLVGPREVLVLNPGEVHGGGPARGSVWRYRAFYPSADLMRRAVQELAGATRGIPRFTDEVVRDPHVAESLRRAHAALEEPRSALERGSRLLQALARLVARHASDKPPVQRVLPEHRAVERARAYLEALPGENVTLETLAGETGLSSFHLCRVFHRQVGLSPHAYQTLVRVRLAKTLLADGVPISRAAVEAGFYDQPHLTRHFKRIFGVTPGRFLAREQLAPGEGAIPGTS
jgi:AraC-like DNA-binding protein